MDTTQVQVRPSAHPLTAAGITSPQQCYAAAARWVQAVAQADSATLRASLLSPTGQNVPFVSFPVQRIAELVSAPGARAIRVLFMLEPDALGEPRFTVALSAADARGERVSGYYTADGYAVAAPAPGLTVQAKTGPGAKNEVPNVLVQQWLTNWAEAQVEASFFQTPYGPLEGHIFEMTDFLAPLFQLTAFGEEELRLHLVLHRYEGLTGPTQALGLAVQIWSPTAFSWGDLIFDQSTPNPPGFGGEGVWP